MGNQNKHINLLQYFFDSAFDVFILFDKNLTILDINNSGLNLLQQKKANVIGKKNITDVLSFVTGSDHYEIYKQVIKTGKAVILEDSTLPALGNLKLSIRAFKVGEGLGIVASNITDLFESIDEINTFIYRLSHDMRGPILNIIGLANIIKFEIYDTDATLNYLEKVVSQATELDYIIKKLSEQSLIRQEENKRDLIDFNTLLYKVIKELSGYIELNKVNVITNINIHKINYYSNSHIIAIILKNLIDNAVKYRKSNFGGFVKISIADHDSGIKIIVEDNGVGIPEEYHKDIFKMFFRGNDKVPGNGLGLYTVKSSVRKLEGQIFVKSKLNEGSTFIVIIPNISDY